MTILEFRQRPKVQKILLEIGQRVVPYVRENNITFKDTDEEPYFEFDDEKGNRVKVFFQDAGKGVQEVEFSVNGDSFQNFTTTTSHYLKILSTVIEVVNKYLKEYDPYILKIDGIDKDIDHRGQKNAIYRAYAKASIAGTDYRVADLPNGFVISK